MSDEPNRESIDIWHALIGGSMTFDYAFNNKVLQFCKDHSLTEGLLNDLQIVVKDFKEKVQ